ncbi:class I SAM-dependent methyltransferase [Streptomyces sp. O3]
MYIQTGAPVTPALDPVPPSRPARTPRGPLTGTQPGTHPGTHPGAHPGAHPAAVQLPGLESVAPHPQDELWLHDSLLGPYSGDIVDFLRLARSTGGPVLDLGAGYGRLAVPFARHGFTVEAVDRDADSLRRLRAWADRIGPRVRGRVTTTHADLAALRLDREYQLALLAGAMISGVHPGARPRMLREIASHLGSGGALALDYTAHETAGLAEDPCRSWPFQVPRFDGVAEWVVARQVFDPAAMSERITYYREHSDKTRVRRSVTSTVKWIVNPDHLARELRAAGLHVADLRQQRLDHRTRAVLLVCRTVR